MSQPRTVSHKGGHHLVNAAALPAKASKKRRGNRRSAGSVVLSEMNKKFSWLPWKRRCILPYTQQIALSTGTSISVFGGDYSFSLNSIVTPLGFPAGATGFTVNGWSKIFDNYKRYQVYGCGIELEFFDPLIDGVVVGWSVQPSSQAVKFLGQFVDNADARQGFATAPISNTGSQKLIKRFYMPIHKAQGIPALNFKVDTANYSANIGFAPVLQPILTIAAANTATGANTTIKCMVRLHYYTTLYDRTTDGNTSYVVI